jgi:hypothetical protein
MLAHIAAEFLCSLGKLGPSFYSVRRGDQKSNADSNSQSGGELQHSPESVMTIAFLAKYLGRAGDSVCGSSIRVLRPLTKIVDLITDSLPESLFRTIRLVEKEKPGSQRYLPKLFHVHVHDSPPHTALLSTHHRDRYTTVRRPFTRLITRVMRASSNRM